MLHTPFHSCTEPLVRNRQWRDWSGYAVASSYLANDDREYFAIRNSVGLIDVSPLFKYEITGPQAPDLVNRIMTRDFRRCRVGRVMYSPWCDDDGEMLQDGNVVRLADDRFRITTADPSRRWFEDCGIGFDASVSDCSEELAALAVQGPRSFALLESVSRGGLSKIRYFASGELEIADSPVLATRTGFTGDLGYELWMPHDRAPAVWDELMAAGADHAVLPAGMLALDRARIEAGLLLIEVDYVSSSRALIEARKSDPFEAGLGWAVDFKEGNDFVGRRALEQRRDQGSRWAFVGLEISFSELERVYGARGVRPQVPVQEPNRRPTPVRRMGRQVGQATSQSYSPVLQRHLALATVEQEVASVGTELELEMAIEFERVPVRARVARLPFYDPDHKRATPPPSPRLAGSQEGPSS